MYQKYKFLLCTKSVNVYSNVLNYNVIISVISLVYYGTFEFLLYSEVKIIFFFTLILQKYNFILYKIILGLKKVSKDLALLDILIY